MIVAQVAEATSGQVGRRPSPQPRWSARADVRRLPVLHVPHATSCTAGCRSATCRCRSRSNVDDHRFWVGDPAVAERDRPDDARPRGPLRARRPAVRRARRSQPHDVRRHVHLLVVQRARAGARTSSRWTRVWPTRQAPGWPTTSPRPTSSCSPTRGAAGPSRTPRSSSVHPSTTRRSPITICLIGSYETNLVLLFERCDGGGGLNPADVAGRAPASAAAASTRRDRLSSDHRSSQPSGRRRKIGRGT